LLQRRFDTFLFCTRSASLLYL